MEVGQKVWHVGKSVTTEEVQVVWMSPNSHRTSHFNPESPVLIERIAYCNPWSKYSLIPVRQLSETKPITKCKASRLFHINGSIVFCDRPSDHIESNDAFTYLHRSCGLDVDIYWADKEK